MGLDEFRTKAFEIAFGQDAINKGYSDQDVIDKLLYHSMEIYCFKSAVKKRLIELSELDQDIPEECFDYCQNVENDVMEFVENGGILNATG